MITKIKSYAYGQNTESRKWSTNLNKETRTKDGNMKIKTRWVHSLGLTEENSRTKEERKPK